MQRLNKVLVRQSFERAAVRYAAASALQRGIAARLMSVSRLYLPVPRPRLCILDAGCGSGTNIPLLSARLAAAPSSRIVGVDIAVAMLQQAERATLKTPRHAHAAQFVCGDLERLPLAASTFDIVFSSAALQWCNDTACGMREFRRVLRGGGLLLAATYGPATLHELRASWAGIDDRAHTLDFEPAQQLSRFCEAAGFRVLCCHRQQEVVFYPDVRSLLSALKRIGVRNCRNDRLRGLTAPAAMQAMMQRYACRYGQRHGGRKVVPASYEVVLLVGQAV